MNVENELTCLTVEGIAELAARRADDVLWLEDSGARTWREFGELVAFAGHQCLAAGVTPGSVVVTPGDAGLESLAWLFGAASVQAVVAPLRAERTGEIAGWQKFVRVDWRVTGDAVTAVGEGTTLPAGERLLSELHRRGKPGLILATGGTTGVPKLVLHELAALLATVPAKTGRPNRTLPLMRFDHIGGLDMAWRALGGGQILVAPPETLTPEAVGTTIARHRVEVMPATPSFLNLLLMAEIHRSHNLSSLRIVPYGAEPMPSGLLDRLRAALPLAEFIQRFGTSETGALPVREIGGGLLLRKGQPGLDWKIVEGELWVRTPARALGYLAGDGTAFTADGWFRTGDLAEATPLGMIRVLGRRAELINVGGEKVLPSEVEGLLLAHPLVADCRVGAESNALLGQVVAAEIVWRGPERDAVAVKRQLREFGEGRIARQKFPVVVRLVESLGATRNLKKLRLAPS